MLRLHSIRKLWVTVRGDSQVDPRWQASVNNNTVNCRDRWSALEDGVVSEDLSERNTRPSERRRYWRRIVSGSIRQQNESEKADRGHLVQRMP
jgi:hypothetical protein